MKTSDASRREKVDLRLEFRDVIPGRCEASNSDVQLHIGESRDSGSGPSDHPGMTTSNNFHGLLRRGASRNDGLPCACVTIPLHHHR